MIFPWLPARQCAQVPNDVHMIVWVPDPAELHPIVKAFDAVGVAYN
jgi:hypothetical protein